jgi:hypothetical protein
MEHPLRMKLTDIYSKLISKEPYNDMEVFFASYESFEEIPLVSRYRRLDFLKRDMSDDRISDILVGLAFFLINSINALTKTDDNPFIAVSFTDFEGLEEQGVLVPNIFVYPKPASIGFLAKVREGSGLASKELDEVKRHFSSCRIKTAFDFYESRFHDAACDENIVRVFAVPKTFEEIHR